MGCGASKHREPGDFFRAGITNAQLAEMTFSVGEGKKLSLIGNKISDVSSLTLPEGLKRLYLNHNRIVDVSKLQLPEGLLELGLNHNLIKDSVNHLVLPASLRILDLTGNPLSKYCLLSRIEREGLTIRRSTT
jgi:hypothetical protein